MRKKQYSQNNHYFPNVYFQVTLPSLMLKLPNNSIRMTPHPSDLKKGGTLTSRNNTFFVSWVILRAEKNNYRKLKKRTKLILCMVSCCHRVLPHPGKIGMPSFQTTTVKYDVYRQLRAPALSSYKVAVVKSVSINLKGPTYLLPR